MEHYNQWPFSLPLQGPQLIPVPLPNMGTRVACTLSVPGKVEILFDRGAFYSQNRPQLAKIPQDPETPEGKTMVLDGILQ